MAQITTEYDSKKKSLYACINGKTVGKIMDISHYCTSHDYKGRPYGKSAKADDSTDTSEASRQYSCSMSIADYDEAHQMLTHTRVVASDSEEGKKLVAEKKGAPLEGAPEFVVAVTKTEITSDNESTYAAILQYLSK